MSVKAHGKFNHPRGRGEQDLRSRPMFTARVAQERKIRICNRSSHEGSSTILGHAIALPEDFREDLLQNRGPAVLASDPSRQSHNDDPIILSFMTERITRNEVETGFPRTSGFIQVPRSLMTECLKSYIPVVFDFELYIPVAFDIESYISATFGFDDVVRGYPGAKKKKYLLTPWHGSCSKISEYRFQFVYSSIEELNRHPAIEPLTKIPEDFDRRVTRALRYWRRAQLPRSQKEDPASANFNGNRTSPEGKGDVVDLPTICRRLVVEWKARAGKNKDWRTSPIRDLLRKVNVRCGESCERRHVPFRAINWFGRNMLQPGVFTATGLREIPRDMLRSYRQCAADSDLSLPLFLRFSAKRKLNCEFDEKKPCYIDMDRKGKRERANDIRDMISEGILFQRVASHTDSEVIDTAIETDEYSTSPPRSDSFLTSKSVVFSESNTRAAGALSIPYESRIGAIVGGRFILQGFVSTKLCYDVHAAKDLCTDIGYTAKVYSIRGTKGNERKYRLTSLKRNASKATYVASIDQGGRKWLFFSGGIEHFVETGSIADASAWYAKEHYQHHFPVLSRRCTTSAIAYRPPKKTYAAYAEEVASESSCRNARKETGGVQEVPMQSDDHNNKRKARVRDRQRNKRKQKRAAEAAARKSVVDDKPTLPEQTSKPVNMSRPVWISDMDSKSGVLSSAKIFDKAEDIGDRLDANIDGRDWEHLTEGLSETLERRCQDVYLRYQNLACTVVRIGDEMRNINVQIGQSLAAFRDIEEAIGFSLVEEDIRFLTLVEKNLRGREQELRKKTDIAFKMWVHTLEDSARIDGKGDKWRYLRRIIPLMKK